MSAQGSRFIVQAAYVLMPRNCWGTYRRVAVLEVDAGVQEVSMISTHARGCRRVVAVWERRNVGHTEGCAYRRALAEAEALAARLNAGANLSRAVAASSADCKLPDVDELYCSRSSTRDVSIRNQLLRWRRAAAARKRPEAA